MRSLIAGFSSSVFIFLAISIYATETADWCKYESGQPCSCFSRATSYNSLVCRYASTAMDLEESVKRILSAKPSDDTPFNFYLSSSKSLPFLPQNLFKGVIVSYLEMMDVDLPQLGSSSESESPLNALSSVLEELFLVRVRYLDDWEWEKVKVSRVQLIRIEQCVFTVLKAAFSDAFPNLKYLYVKHSDVKVIEPQALAFPNKKIEYITFLFTKLASLSRESFRRKDWTEDDRLDNLVTLDISENKIESISDDFFIGMEKLQYMFINSNPIKKLSTNFFGPCAKSEWSCSLKIFYNSGNPLDIASCQYLVDLSEKYEEAVDIQISLRCARLLGFYPDDLK